MIGLPRFFEANPAGPSSSYAVANRRTCRAPNPNRSPAFPWDSRPSSTLRITPMRAISVRLIVTSSFAIGPTSAQHLAGKSGHFYLALTFN